MLVQKAYDIIAYMLSSHLFKVVIGFCGMILLGLILLVVIDSYKPKNKVSEVVVPEVQATNNTTPQSKSVTTPSIKKPNPQKKSTQ